MKYLSHIFISALLLISTSVVKAVSLEISYAQYITTESEPYLELFFALNGNSLGINTTDNGNYYGGIEATVTFTQNDVIKAADKFRILSPEFKDSNMVSGTFFQQERYALPAGSYTLNINLFDISNPENVLKTSQKIRINGSSEKPSTSDLLFLLSYKPATESSAYSKSGYEIIPKVSSGNYYFSPEQDQLSFYVELYDIQKAVPPGDPYVIRYFIEAYDSKKLLNKYSSFSKKIAGQVEPLMASFDISDLPTGNYNLVVEALNKEGNSILEKKVFFFRQNENKELTETALEDLDYTGTFVDDIDDFDSLYTYLHYLKPISTDSEQRFQDLLRSQRDIKRMKTYLLAFWQNRNPENPGKGWNDYLREVRIANKYYSTRIQQGFLSARGRVYLLYGKPSLVEQRKFEPGLPPYEMWQYNTIGSPYVARQTNKVFVFAEFDPSTNDYQLIHSNAIGELNNRRWQYDLAQGTYGTGNDIDQNRIETGDGFGSRLNNNIIIQGGGNSEINR